MELHITRIGSLELIQPKYGYRFSLEPFVLADNAKLKRNDNVVDFGSGCGIIAILIARENPLANVVAVEASDEMRKIIKENCKLNGVSNVTVIESLTSVQTNSVDMLITNPPYFKEGFYRPSPRYKLEKFESIPLKGMLSEFKRILKNRSILRISYHPTRLVELIVELDRHGFGIKTITPAFGNPNRPAQFVVVEAMLAGKHHTKINPVFDLLTLAKRLRYHVDQEKVSL